MLPPNLAPKPLNFDGARAVPVAPKVSPAGQLYGNFVAMPTYCQTPDSLLKSGQEGGPAGAPSSSSWLAHSPSIYLDAAQCGFVNLNYHRVSNVSALSRGQRDLPYRRVQNNRRAGPYDFIGVEAIVTKTHRIASESPCLDHKQQANTGNN